RPADRGKQPIEWRHEKPRTRPRPAGPTPARPAADQPPPAARPAPPGRPGRPGDGRRTGPRRQTGPRRGGARARRRAAAPPPARRLAAVAELAGAAEARLLVGRLRDLYDRGDSPFQVEELAGGYQLLTRPAYDPWLVRFRRSSPDLRLTPALWETLAVV